MTYTPGPWEVRDIPERGETLVMGADGNWLASITGSSPEETAANARVMATSLELLESCEAFLEFCESVAEAGNKMAAEVASSIRIIIAKAKGEK